MTVFSLVMTWVAPTFLKKIAGDKRVFFETLQKKSHGVTCSYKSSASAEICQIHGEWKCVSRSYEILDQLEQYAASVDRSITPEMLVRVIAVVASVDDNKRTSPDNPDDPGDEENHDGFLDHQTEGSPPNDPNISNKQEQKTEKIEKKCPVCDKICTSVQSFRHHLLTHEEGYIDKPFLCTICGKAFKNESAMVEHENIHTGVKPYSCTVCGKGFPYKGSLRIHLMTHLTKRYYKCKICGKEFKQASSLRVHKHIHSGRRFECTECHKMFTQKQAMIRHKRIHTGERPLACSICGSAFNDYSILNRHLQGIHKIKNFSEMRKGAKAGTFEPAVVSHKPRGRGFRQSKMPAINIRLSPPTQVNPGARIDLPPSEENSLSLPGHSMQVPRHDSSPLISPTGQSNSLVVHSQALPTHLDPPLHHHPPPSISGHTHSPDVGTSANAPHNSMNIDHSQLLYNMYNYWGY